METNVAGLISDIEEKLAGTEERKLRFFRLEELKRNIIRLGKYGAECEICPQFIPETESLTSHICEAVNVPGNERRELDRLIFRLSHHMIRHHGYYPAYYFGFRYSILGIFAGMVAGFLLSKVISTGNEMLLPMAGLVTGLFTGQILGRIRDKKVRDSGKVM